MADSKLLEKVLSLQDKFASLQEQLSSPDVMSDMKKYVQLNKDYKELEPIIKAGLDYKKKMEEIVRERTVLLKRDLLSRARETGGRRLVVIDNSVDPQMLRNAALMLQNETENLIVTAAYEAGGKPQLLLMYSPDLVKAGKNAQADIKEAAKCIQGGGGGQPGLATAGGKLLAGLSDALDKLIGSATR